MSSKHLENEGQAQSTADRLLHLLKTRGTQQAADAGQVLGMTAEAARQQFTKLAANGLVEAYSEARGVGRPAQFWQLTGKGHGRFPDTHSDLTVQLLDSVRQTFGESAIDTLISIREQQNLDNYQAAIGDADSLLEKVKRLTEIRCREGYMAEYVAEDDGTLTFIENHCPICSAATSCQGFCRSELDIFERILDARVERTEHILTQARRCCYTINPR